MTDRNREFVAGCWSPVRESADHWTRSWHRILISVRLADLCSRCHVYRDVAVSQISRSQMCDHIQSVLAIVLLLYVSMCAADSCRGS